MLNLNLKIGNPGIQTNQFHNCKEAIFRNKKMFLGNTNKNKNDNENISEQNISEKNRNLHLVHKSIDSRKWFNNQNNNKNGNTNEKKKNVSLSNSSLVFINGSNEEKIKINKRERKLHIISNQTKSKIDNVRKKYITFHPAIRLYEKHLNNSSIHNMLFNDNNVARIKTFNYYTKNPNLFGFKGLENSYHSNSNYSDEGLFLNNSK